MVEYKLAEGDWQQWYLQNVPTLVDNCINGLERWFEENHEIENRDWYQALYVHPAFQHLCFRFGNNVYSVIIALKADDGLMMLEQDLRNQIRECEGNNMIPVFMMIDITNPQQATFVMDEDGFIFYSSIDGSLVRLEHGEKTNISQWEIYALGICAALDIVAEKEWNLNGVCFVPGITPQIWAADKEGNRIFVIVEVRDGHATDAPKIGAEFYERLRTAGIGAYVTVICSEDRSALYRGDKVPFVIRMEPLDEKIMREGLDSETHSYNIS